MQQTPLVLTRLDRILLARQPVEDGDAHAGLPDAVAQLGGEIPLDLFSREGADAVEQTRDANFRARLGKERASGRDGIARIASAHDHLIGMVVGADRGHRELFAHGPKAQETDAEFPLQTGRSVRLHPALDRIADVSGDVTKVGPPLRIARNALAVIADRKIMPAVLAPARDGDRARLCINAVFDELRDRLERAALGERDDGDRVPVVTDLELAARLAGLFQRAASVHSGSGNYGRYGRIFASSWRGLKGLGTKSSHPAARAFSSSPLSA